LKACVQSDGELKPASKGLALTPEQFNAIRDAEPAISAALAAGDTAFELALSSKCGPVRTVAARKSEDCAEGLLSEQSARLHRTAHLRPQPRSHQPAPQLARQAVQAHPGSRWACFEAPTNPVIQQLGR